jgi:hypothetical protein
VDSLNVSTITIFNVTSLKDFHFHICFRVFKGIQSVFATWNLQKAIKTFDALARRPIPPRNEINNGQFTVLHPFGDADKHKTNHPAAVFFLHKRRRPRKL